MSKILTTKEAIDSLRKSSEISQLQRRLSQLRDWLDNIEGCGYDCEPCEKKKEAIIKEYRDEMDRIKAEIENLKA